MFDKFSDIVVGIIFFVSLIFIVLAFSYFGYVIYGNYTAPYIIRANDSDYYIQEYREENGYYYATTISGNECKIPVDIAVIKENK